MIATYRFGADARVLAIGDAQEVIALIQAGRAKITLRLAGDAARRLALELEQFSAPGAGETRRPKPPAHPPRNWTQIAARFRSRTMLDSDFDSVQSLFSHLGLQ